MAGKEEHVKNMLSEFKKTAEDMARHACDQKENDLRLQIDNLHNDVTRLKEEAVRVQAAAVAASDAAAVAAAAAAGAMVARTGPETDGNPPTGA